MGSRIALLFGSQDSVTAARINRDTALLGIEVILLEHSGRCENVLRSAPPFDSLAFLITPDGLHPGNLQIMVDWAHKHGKFALALIYPGADFLSWVLLEGMVKIHLDIQRPGYTLERILNVLSETPGMEKPKLTDLYTFATIAFASALDP